MNTAFILELIFFGIAAIYLIFTLAFLFKEKRITIKDKIVFILISFLLLGRNAWLIISGLTIKKIQ